METGSLAKIFGLVVVLVGALILSPSPSRADTTYSYTGVLFTSFVTTGCLPVCEITGSFTVASPLASGITGMPDFTPMSFSFTDGLTKWTNLNSTIFVMFAVDTSATGAITAWDINLIGPGSGGGLFTYFDGPGTFQEGVNIDSYQAYAPASDTGGTWTESSTGGGVAEPSSLLMLGVGLISLLALALKNPSRRYLGIPHEFRP